MPRSVEAQVFVHVAGWRCIPSPNEPPLGGAAAGMAEVGTAAAGAVVAGAGAVSALASEPVCFSLLLATMATRLLTAMALMAMGTVAPTMAMAATTRAIGTQVTPIVVITIDMVATTHIVGTPTAENRAALDHRRKTAVKAVFLFLPAAGRSFLRRVDVVIE